jgi:A/G-specific adenine glycosylase
MPEQPWVQPLTTWYDESARDLPWRAAGVTPYAVLVSEVMLQQTPVARVLPVYDRWVQRWPSPRALAADSPGEAVREWGRLGYPRRALRLHEACAQMVERFDGELPTTVPELLSLPGVGEYTARAVAVFALGQRHAVVDTNVRRVVARLVEGVADAAVTRADLGRIEALLPESDVDAGRVSIALMELGALVCTARSPRCGTCPVSAACAWLGAGSPGLDAPVRAPQGYAGTDRQVRGRLLGVLRDSDGPVHAELLRQVWDLPEQRDRALESLLADGLVTRLPDGRFALPA